ncbi:pilus assembly protein CpaE [Deltaproteobacteria bacterium]|nr:pilus assembly protein CpaE [Deltaproteobacteria bacterium]
MRGKTPSGSASNAASVIVVGVDARAMGQVRETLGTEAVLPTTPIPYEDAVAAVRRQRPDVVITGFDADPEEAVRLAPLLMNEVGSKIHLVALSSGADPDRIRAAMRAGYREFVVLPADAELLRQAVHEATFAEDRDDDSGEVVAMWGSKGGVGTTFLAINLAGELSPVHRVCVADLDFAMGDVAAFLDLTPPQSIADVFRNIGRLDERMLAGSVAVHSSKIHVLGQPSDLEHREEPRGDLVMRVLTATSRAYQYVIADCGSSLDEASVTAATVADYIVIITTPDVPSVKDTWRRLQFIEKLGLEKERLRLVVSRYDRKTAQLSIADIETNLGRRVDATVAEDRNVLRSIHEGTLLRDVDKRCEGARDIGRLVSLVTGEETAEESKPTGFFGRLLGR